MTVVIVATVRKKCTKQKGKDDCNDEETIVSMVTVVRKERIGILQITDQ